MVKKVLATSMALAMKLRLVIVVLGAPLRPLTIVENVDVSIVIRILYFDEVVRTL
jgi:hypothetical protein